MVVLTQRITPMRVVDKQGSEKELFEVKIPEKQHNGQLYGAVISGLLMPIALNTMKRRCKANTRQTVKGSGCTKAQLNHSSDTNYHCHIFKLILLASIFTMIICPQPGAGKAQIRMQQGKIQLSIKQCNIRIQKITKEFNEGIDFSLIAVWHIRYEFRSVAKTISLITKDMEVERLMREFIKCLIQLKKLTKYVFFVPWHRESMTLRRTITGLSDMKGDLTYFKVLLYHAMTVDKQLFLSDAKSDFEPKQKDKWKFNIGFLRSLLQEMNTAKTELEKKCNNFEQSVINQQKNKLDMLIKICQKLIRGEGVDPKMIKFTKQDDGFDDEDDEGMEGKDRKAEEDRGSYSGGGAGTSGSRQGQGEEKGRARQTKKTQEDKRGDKSEEPTTSGLRRSQRYSSRYSQEGDQDKGLGEAHHHRGHSQSRTRKHARFTNTEQEPMGPQTYVSSPQYHRPYTRSQAKDKLSHQTQSPQPMQYPIIVVSSSQGPTPKKSILKKSSKYDTNSGHDDINGNQSNGQTKQKKVSFIKYDNVRQFNTLQPVDKLNLYHMNLRKRHLSDSQQVTTSGSSVKRPKLRVLKKEKPQEIAQKDKTQKDKTQKDKPQKDKLQDKEHQKQLDDVPNQPPRPRSPIIVYSTFTQSKRTVTQRKRSGDKQATGQASQGGIRLRSASVIKLANKSPEFDDNEKMEVDQSHSHSSHHGHKHKDQPSYLSSQHRLSRDKAEGK